MYAFLLRRVWLALARIYAVEVRRKANGNECAGGNKLHDIERFGEHRDSCDTRANTGREESKPLQSVHVLHEYMVAAAPQFPNDITNIFKRSFK